MVELAFKQQNEVEPIGDGLQNSIIPSVQESERFISYLNKRFSLGLPDNLIITIEGVSPRYKGYFMSQNKIKGYTNTKQDLNTITLNSIFLKETPYETIAHEVAHFINAVQGIQDCSSSQYHNKHFKAKAEMLLLEVKKTKHGYSETNETNAFKIMLQEFSPNPNAFHIAQYHTDKERKQSRMVKYVCSCGCIIRTARNKDKPLKAVCEYCDTAFSEVEKC